MINPKSFTVENLKIGFKIILDSHSINHANSILSIIPIYSGSGFETRHTNKILPEKSTIYARLLNQYKTKNLFIIFSHLL